MIFTNAYAAASNCAPSRAGLMTGLWANRHRIFTVNSSARGKAQNRRLIPIENTITLADTFLTIPKFLSQQGYSTCHAGKWHLSDDPGLDGFQVNIGGGHNGHPSSYYPPYKNVPLESEEGMHLTDLITSKTIEYLDTVNQPFFLNYSPYAVHTPIQAIDSLLPKYEDKSPSNGQDNASYATMIENLDRNIGLLLSQLKEKKLSKNTLIIFTSDNGGLYGITRQSPLRAGKGSYYEGGIRVPFALIWPGKIPSGTKCDNPVTHLDIFPTILNLFQGKADHDGRNLMAVINNPNVYGDQPLYWHFPIYLQAYLKTGNENRDSLFRTRPGSVIRKGDWKLHYYFEDKGIELYNLSDDIGEKINLHESNPGKSSELFIQLQEWWKTTKAPIEMEINSAFIK